MSDDATRSHAAKLLRVSTDPPMPECPGWRGERHVCAECDPEMFAHATPDRVAKFIPIKGDEEIRAMRAYKQRHPAVRITAGMLRSIRRGIG